jgi:hypothetical protein
MYIYKRLAASGNTTAELKNQKLKQREKRKA